MEQEKIAKVLMENMKLEIDDTTRQIKTLVISLVIKCIDISNKQLLELIEKHGNKND